MATFHPNSNLGRAVKALRKIAAFNDKMASEILKNTGSYSAFDEPGAVCTAREALKKLGITE